MVNNYNVIWQLIMAELLLLGSCLIHDRYIALLTIHCSSCMDNCCKVHNWFDDNCRSDNHRSCLVQSHADFFRGDKRGVKRRLVMCGKNGIIVMQMVQEFKPF